MAEMVKFSLERQFSNTSDNGLTFHWLRCVLGQELASGISKAFRIVYLPSALCVAPESVERFCLERQQSVSEFEEWMTLPWKSFSENPIPNRIEFDADFEFPEVSDNGKTLAWMLSTFGDKTGDEIVRSVKLVYLPSALNAFPEHQARVDAVILQSRFAFSDKRACDALPKESEILPFKTNGKPHELAAVTHSPQAVSDPIDKRQENDDSECSKESPEPSQAVHEDDWNLDMDEYNRAVYGE